MTGHLCGAYLPEQLLSALHVPYLCTFHMLQHGRLPCTYLDRHCMLIMWPLSSGSWVGSQPVICLWLRFPSWLEAVYVLGGAVLRETWNGILPDSLIVPLRWNCNMVWCVCRCGALDCQLCAWLLFRALANKACTIRHVWCRRVWGAVRWQGQVGNTFGKPLVSFLIKYVVMLIGISQISFISHLRFWKRGAGRKVHHP